jgi:enediyne biosynthesis protein E4
MSPVTGIPDLLVTSLQEGNSLYINDGTGRFTLNENSGLGESRGATSMALADISGNGLPDLYITNYNSITARDLYRHG